MKVPPSWVWLFLHIDEGLIGIGEPFLENHPDSVIAELRRLEPVLIGQDPRRIEALWAAMYNTGLGYKGGPVTMSAMSAMSGGLDSPETYADFALRCRDMGYPAFKIHGTQRQDTVDAVCPVAATKARCLSSALALAA